MIASSENWWVDFLTPCNRTELYQICRRKGLEVLPSASREDMIMYIAGTKEPPVVDHQIDAWRRGIMAVIIDHREVVQATLSCPAKTMDPEACFQCPDTQVLSCLVQNPNDEPLIATRRLVRHTNIRRTNMPQEALTLENAPRTPAELQQYGAFRIMALGRELAQITNPQTGLAFIPSVTNTAPEARKLWQALMCGKPETVVAALLPILLQHDAIKKGLPNVPATALAQPSIPAAMVGGPISMPTGPVGGMTGGTTAGAAVEPAATGKGVRTPKAPATGDTAELAAAIKGLQAELANNTASINALGASVGKLVLLAEQQSLVLGNIDTMTKGNVRTGLVSVAIMLEVAQAVLQVAMPEVAQNASLLAGMVPSLLEGEPATGNG